MIDDGGARPRGPARSTPDHPAAFPDAFQSDLLGSVRLHPSGPVAEDARVPPDPSLIVQLGAYGPTVPCGSGARELITEPFPRAATRPFQLPPELRLTRNAPQACAITGSQRPDRFIVILGDRYPYT